MKPWIHVLLVSLVITMAFILFVTMYYFDGKADMTRYGEGWYETALFAFAGVIGLWDLMTSPR